MKREKIKQFLKENIYIIVIFLVGIFFIYLPIPYYIEAPGGLIDTSNRIDIQDKNPSNGSFEMAYVSSIKASIPTLLFASFHEDWDIIKKEEVVAEGETEKEAEYRSRLSLEEGNQIAIIKAYQAAGKYIEIKKQNIYITYLFQEANTNLKVGDKVEKVMNKPVNSFEEFYDIIQSYPVGTKLDITVKEDLKEKNRYAYVIESENKKMLGIVPTVLYDLNMKPGIKIKTDQNESGGSGGLIMTLSIYNALTKEDITKGRKIAGTGTMEKNGTVGSIAGVKYKLIGADKKKADIFFVPDGENFQEALKVKKKKNLKIKLVPVKTLDEALSYLKNRD